MDLGLMFDEELDAQVDVGEHIRRIATGQKDKEGKGAKWGITSNGNLHLHSAHATGNALPVRDRASPPGFWVDHHIEMILTIRCNHGPGLFGS
jgi:hypothetical protein